MPKWIEALKGIKTEELNERVFYERVLSIVKEMEGVSFTTETLEEFRTALEEIGCMDYDTWKSQKELSGEIIGDGKIGDGIDKADIKTAVSFISQFFFDCNNANYSISKMVDGGWVEQWVKNSQEKSQSKQNIPYYQVAKKALMNWNGLSEEEATKIISTQSFDQIDSQVYAKGSMDYAIEGMKIFLGLSDKDTEELSTFVYEGNQSKIMKLIKENEDISNRLEKKSNAQSIDNVKSLTNELIIDTLFHVHDGWVKDNVKKFNAREKKHQHMPSELIGWKEAKADLLFVRPIFEAAGIQVDEDKLEQVYNGRVKEFFLNKGIENARSLSDYITQGEKFYPALEGYGDILVTINDPFYVDEKIIPAIEEKGIGNIEEVRRNIFSQVISNPISEDVARLSDKEKGQLEQSLGKEVSELAAQRDELQQKNSIVERIMALANRRNDIKKEIYVEEQKKFKNSQGFDGR